MSMRYISKFPRAVAGTTLFMGAIYLMIGCVGYQRLGSDFDLTKPVMSPAVADISNLCTRMPLCTPAGL